MKELLRRRLPAKSARTDGPFGITLRLDGATAGPDLPAPVLCWRMVRITPFTVVHCTGPAVHDDLGLCQPHIDEMRTW